MFFRNQKKMEQENNKNCLSVVINFFSNCKPSTLLLGYLLLASPKKVNALCDLNQIIYAKLLTTPGAITTWLEVHGPAYLENEAKKPEAENLQKEQDYCPLQMHPEFGDECFIFEKDYEADNSKIIMPLETCISASDDCKLDITYDSDYPYNLYAEHYCDLNSDKFKKASYTGSFFYYGGLYENTEDALLGKDPKMQF